MPSGSTQCGWGRPCRWTMYGSGVWKRIGLEWVSQSVACAGPGADREIRMGVTMMAATAALETGGRFTAAAMRRKGDAGDTGTGLDAGMELVERGARRAVTGFWGRLHGFTQLGVGCSGSPPPNPKGNRSGTEVLGAVVWGTDKRADSSAADAHVMSRVGWPRWGRPGGCAERVLVGLWRAHGG